MHDLLTRFFGNLTGRVGGPMSFRLVIQPLVATFLAVRAGLKDARQGKPIYGWTVFTDPVYRRELLHAGWKDVAKVYVVAVILDCIYQIIVARWIYPGEALVVAAILAILPYLFIRGPVNRIARRFSKGGKRSPAAPAEANPPEKMDQTNDRPC